MSTLEERIRAAGDAARLLRDIRSIQDPVALATVIRANGEVPGSLYERLTKERGWTDERMRGALVAICNGTTGDVRLTKKETARLRQAARSSVAAGGVPSGFASAPPVASLGDQLAAHVQVALRAGASWEDAEAWARSSLQGRVGASIDRRRRQPRSTVVPGTRGGAASRRFAPDQGAPTARNQPRTGSTTPGANQGRSRATRTRRSS